MPFPKKMKPGEDSYMASHGHAPENEKHEPEEEALLSIHRTILGRMGEKLQARMPKPPKPADLPMAHDSPPKSPAAAHVEKLKAHLARGK